MSATTSPAQQRGSSRCCRQHEMTPSSLTTWCSPASAAAACWHPPAGDAPPPTHAAGQSRHQSCARHQGTSSAAAILAWQFTSNETTPCTNGNRNTNTLQNSHKLSYCRGTVQRSVLVSSCYVSRVSIVSVSKSDLQGHSMALVPFDRPHTISYYCSIATISLSGTDNKILSLISQNFNRSHDSEHLLSWPSG